MDLLKRIQLLKCYNCMCFSMDFKDSFIMNLWYLYVRIFYRDDI